MILLDYKNNYFISELKVFLLISNETYEFRALRMKVYLNLISIKNTHHD